MSKPATERRLEETEAKAFIRALRVSARKLNLVAQTIRGQSASSALAELTTSRVKMFFRETGAVFWAFVFPILLTVALGIAFRNRPPEPVRVVVPSPLNHHEREVYEQLGGREGKPAEVKKGFFDSVRDALRG